jgi:predicted RNA binding protein YcfA (HicA-like mRNA interferase family)
MDYSRRRNCQGIGTVSKVPNLPSTQIIAALERDGWIVVRQRGSHIRLEKSIPDEVLKLTVLAHRSVKRSTLAKILKQARIDLERFLDLL